jgi:hypothetical protein
MKPGDVLPAREFILGQRTMRGVGYAKRRRAVGVGYAKERWILQAPDFLGGAGVRARRDVP